MKQNSSIMFHGTRKSLTFCYFCKFLFLGLASITSLGAAEPPPYAAYYDAEKGFKPVQPSLSKIFLQIAGSLESSGSPEPYIRHVMAEHARIDKKYQAQGGKGSSRPDYLTEEYLDRLIANWNTMKNPLKLESFCRNAGKNMRYAILGSKNMSISELVEFETALSELERDNYRTLLGKDYFSKADFPATEKFYAGIFDKLTGTGQDQISRRTWLGTQSPDIRAKEIAAPLGGTALVRLLNDHQDATVAYLEDRKNRPKTTAESLEALLIRNLKLDSAIEIPKNLAPSDAEPLRFTHEIRDAWMFRVASVRKQIKPVEKAEEVVETMNSMIRNLVIVAQSEFEAAIYDASRR